jgi:hypothetical protein
MSYQHRALLSRMFLLHLKVKMLVQMTKAVIWSIFQSLYFKVESSVLYKTFFYLPARLLFLADPLFLYVVVIPDPYAILQALLFSQ